MVTEETDSIVGIAVRVTTLVSIVSPPPAK
jgi:hypothetical protein